MKVLKLIKHPLLSGSLIMVLGSNLFNFGQFVYHFIVGRLLGKVYYGDLAAIISILAFFSIIQLSIGLTIVKFITSKKTKEEIANLSKWFNHWALVAGGIVAILTLILSPMLIKFLNITQPAAVYLLAPTLFFTIVTFTYRSILQGLLLFGRYVTSLLVEAVAKIILTIVLVFSGFSVFGAMGGIGLGILSSYFITRFSLSAYLVGKKGKVPEILPLVKYSLPVFLQGLALTSMYSTDLILVKHFFPEDTAGIYASLAVLGRVAFFGSSPIIHVMFPLIAKRHTLNQPYLNIFYLSILLVSVIAGAVVMLYLLLPKLVVGIFYGQDFIEGAPMLWWFGLFMAVLSVAVLFIQFYLSLGKTKVVWFFIAAAFLQAILIWFIHPDLLTVIKLSILSVALLVASLIVYFPYHKR